MISDTLIALHDRKLINRLLYMCKLGSYFEITTDKKKIAG